MMPKMKTHKSSSKRFKRTATGKFKRTRAFSTHLRAGKTSKRKRRLTSSALVNKADLKHVKRLLPYS